jgi:hypothetical protein
VLAVFEGVRLSLPAVALPLPGELLPLAGELAATLRASSLSPSASSDWQAIGEASRVRQATAITASHEDASKR